MHSTRLGLVGEALGGALGKGLVAVLGGVLVTVLAQARPAIAQPPRPVPSPTTPRNVGPHAPAPVRPAAPTTGPFTPATDPATGSSTGPSTGSSTGSSTGRSAGSSTGPSTRLVPVRGRGPMPPTSSKPGMPDLVGAISDRKITVAHGFIDDAVVVDDAHVAYVASDAGNLAELHVVDQITKAEQIVNLAPFTQQVTQLAFVGARVLVIGKTGDSFSAALIASDPRAKQPFVWRSQSATDATLIMRDGRQRLALHRTSPTANGGVKHEVELLALDTGKRVGAVRTLAVDSTSTNEKLGFRINDWADGWTRPHGIKSGEWDRRENQRAPDYEVTYDLPTGRFVDKKKIEDLFEQRRRFQTLAEATGKTNFIRFSWDNASLQIWRSGQLRLLDLDQPLTTYDPKSMQGVIAANGSAWIALKVDPVNAEAVARKKADPEYLDIFQVSTDGKIATRKARILATGTRYHFGLIGLGASNRFWLVERNTGFDRGGKSLALYTLQ